MSEIKDEEVIINGKKTIKKMCEFVINLDERIADGYYFTKCDNPELLMEEAAKKIKIEEIR